MARQILVYLVDDVTPDEIDEVLNTLTEMRQVWQVRMPADHTRRVLHIPTPSPEMLAELKHASENISMPEIKIVE